MGPGLLMQRAMFSGLFVDMAMSTDPDRLIVAVYKGSYVGKQLAYFEIDAGVFAAELLASKLTELARDWKALAK